MNKNNVLSLEKASIGCKYRIIDIYCENLKSSINQFYNFGIYINSRITPIYESMIKGVTAYLVKGSVVAVRNIDAKNIIVTQI